MRDGARDIEGQIAQRVCSYLTSGPHTVGEIQAFAHGMAAGSYTDESTPLPPAVAPRRRRGERKGPRALTPDEIHALGARAIQAVEELRFDDARQLVAELAHASPELARVCASLIESLDIATAPAKAKYLRPHTYDVARPLADSASSWVVDAAYDELAELRAHPPLTRDDPAWRVASDGLGPSAEIETSKPRKRP
jgi:hypothetical protein